MSSDDSNHSEEELQIVQEDELMEQEPVSLEDLDASDIDDEDGDLILEQKVTINNEVEYRTTPFQYEPRQLYINCLLVI